MDNLSCAPVSDSFLYYLTNNCVFCCMTLDQSFYIGYISKTRGLKGEVQLFFEFEDYAELVFDIILIEVNKKLVPYFVDNIKVQKNSTAYVTFEDIDHISKAEELVRHKVYLPNDKLPVRDPNDFRYSDLVGFLVIDETEGELGEITQVQDLPQQHVATVDMGDRELLFPLSEEMILGIDIQERVIEVDLPDGLVDLYRQG